MTTDEKTYSGERRREQPETMRDHDEDDIAPHRRCGTIGVMGVATLDWPLDLFADEYDRADGELAPEGNAFPPFLCDAVAGAVLSRRPPTNGAAFGGLTP